MTSGGDYFPFEHLASWIYCQPPETPKARICVLLCLTETGLRSECIQENMYGGIIIRGIVNY
jgi:hypothetical protein